MNQQAIKTADGNCMPSTAVVRPCPSTHVLLLLHHLCNLVVEHCKVPVVVLHGAAQDRDVFCGHHVEHCVVADSCMLSLTLCMNLHNNNNNSDNTQSA